MLEAQLDPQSYALHYESLPEPTLHILTNPYVQMFQWKKKCWADSKNPIAKPT